MSEQRASFNREYIQFAWIVPILVPWIAVSPLAEEQKPQVPIIHEDPRYQQNKCMIEGGDCPVDPEIYYGSPPKNRSEYYNSVGLDVVKANSNGQTNSYVCSGTLVSSTIVLSARHCIEPSYQNGVKYEVKSIDAVFGLDLEQTNDPQAISIKVVDCADFEKTTYMVCNKDQNTRPSDRDIIALRLASEAPTFPAKLATGNMIDSASRLTAIGFGLTEVQGPNNTRRIGTKLVVDVPIVTNDCDGLVNGTSDADRYHCIKDIELVAGRGSYNTQADADTCGGDSGGTMYLTTIPVSGDGATRQPIWPFDYYLAGVTSRAIHVPQASWPWCGDGGIYGRVDEPVTAWLAMLAEGEGSWVIVGD